MKRTIFVSLTFLALMVPAARAGILVNDYCNPSDASAWGSSVNGAVGTVASTTGVGSVTVSSGDSLACSRLYLGQVNDSAGNLTIESGGIMTTNDQARVAYGTGSTSEILVTGTNSTWTVNSSCVMGWYGNTTLKILDGGTLNSKVAGFSTVGYKSSSKGTATISGINSLWDAGSQTFYLSSESSVTVKDYGTLVCGENYIGYNGFGKLGKLAVEAHGTVNATDTRIGYNSDANGELLVSGNDAVWNSTGDLTVGWFGKGSMTITDGGAISNTDAWVGYVTDGLGGTVEISNGGVWNNSAGLIVGRLSSGTLSITEGGFVNATGLTIDEYDGGESFVRMTTGGMLALPISTIDGNTTFDSSSLSLVLAEIGGDSSALQWFNPALNAGTGDWDSISTATFGTDYTLDYIDSGDLAGYTQLTVAEVPEPSMLVLLLGLIALPIIRRLRA